MIPTGEIGMYCIKFSAACARGPRNRNRKTARTRNVKAQALTYELAHMHWGSPGAYPELAKGLITAEEHAARARILAEI